MAQAPPNALSITTGTRGTMTLGYIIKSAAPLEEFVPPTHGLRGGDRDVHQGVMTGR